MALTETERKMDTLEKEGKKKSRDAEKRRRNALSLQPEKMPEVPELTARIARRLHPKGNKYMWLRDELDAIYNDEQFTSLYPKSGQLAEQPWRLAIMTIVSF